MNESAEAVKNPFKVPDIHAEHGEFERVSEQFGIDTSVLEFQAQAGELVDLHEDVWRVLENADSFDIEKGDWVRVRELAAEAGRDWETTHNKLLAGKAIDAPIIMKYKSGYHLVSGNTRLMVARAMGIRPKVFVFGID